MVDRCSTFFIYVSTAKFDTLHIGNLLLLYPMTENSFVISLLAMVKLKSSRNLIHNRNAKYLLDSIPRHLQIAQPLGIP